MTTLYPTGYQTSLVTLDTLRREHTASGDGFGMEPVYADRLFDWIAAQGGLIGIGDGWRPYGSDTSPASAANKSFHQTQQFGDGTRWFCAVDLVAVAPGTVHRSPTWAEVPEQGSPDATAWGVHANVPGEPWHLQPIELDGFDSWDRAGRPRPTPIGPSPQPPGGDDVEKWCVRDVDGWPWVTDFASYAVAITEDQAARGRDIRGYTVAPDGGPWPIDAQDTDLMHRLAGQ